MGSMAFPPLWRPYLTGMMPMSWKVLGLGVAAIGWVACCLNSQIAAADELEALEEQAFRAAVEVAAPAVVRIETLGGLEKVGELVVSVGPTTGLIVSEDGYILSSAFNFVQLPASIIVTLPDGKRAAAEIVARDRSRMLVLLKVKTDDKLPVARPASRSEMQVGQWTLALGRTFSTERPNVSVGVLSAVNRIWGKAIQTDAKVSPSNYGGPLIDLQGRVLGVLVPLSPQKQEEIAGAEWYDSGIGFAVPLDDILARLDQLKGGNDLHPGVMGIAMKGSDVYVDPAEVAAVRVKSPAEEAGLKVGDVIVEAQGRPVERQAQLKHVLGPLYAGDKLAVKVKRGEETVDTTLTLVDKLIPYEHPFLGVLPSRGAPTSDQKGFAVRFVYPEGPAAQAGIKSGDRIVRIEDQDIQNAETARNAVANQEPGNRVRVTIGRDSGSEVVEVELGALPTAIPGELPPDGAADAAAEEAQRPPSGILEIKIPEEPNECFAYIPESYRGDGSAGLLVWLHAPGGYDQNKLVEQWKPVCEQYRLVLLAPRAADAKAWNPTEVQFIRKTIDEVVSNYAIDRNRVVLHGYQAGGAMAYLTAFAHRELVRGVAAIDCALPRRVQVPDNDPIQRLAFLTTLPDKSRLAPAIKATIKSLGELKFPVTVLEIAGGGRALDADERAALARWIDTLDRL